MSSNLLNSKLDSQKVTKYIKELKKEYPNASDDELWNFLTDAGPQALYKAGLLKTDGWREGYTKKTLSRRKAERRKRSR